MAHHSYPIGAAPITVIDSRTYNAWVDEIEGMINRVARIGYCVHTMSLVGVTDTEIVDRVRDFKIVNDLLQHVIDLLHIEEEGGNDGD